MIVTGRYRIRKGWFGKSILEREILFIPIDGEKYPLWRDCPYSEAPSCLLEANKMWVEK